MRAKRNHHIPRSLLPIHRSAPTGPLPICDLPYPITIPRSLECIRILDVRKPYVPTHGYLNPRASYLSHIFRFFLIFLIILHQNVQATEDDHFPNSLPSPAPSSLSSAASTTSNLSLTSSATTPSPSSHRLSIGPVTDHPTLTTCIHLIATSIRQQRHTTLTYLLLHPPTLLLPLTLFIFLLPSLPTHLPPPTHVLSCLLLSLALHLAILYTLCATYELHALSFQTAPDLLQPTRPHPTNRFSRQDLVFCVRRGPRVLSTAIIRLYPAPATTGSRYRKHAPGTAVVRAWTTEESARRHGYGKLVMRAAMKEARNYCGKDVQVTVSRQHANSQGIPFGWGRELEEKNVQIARTMLASVLEVIETPRKKR